VPGQPADQPDKDNTSGRVLEMKAESGVYSGVAQLTGLIRKIY